MTQIPDLDADLLAAWRKHHDEARFFELCLRHTGLVAGMCRRLGSPDADEATQAVFLVLARRAGTVDDRGLTGWLVGTTRRVVAHQRRASASRRRHELEAAMELDRQRKSPTDPFWEEARCHLDEALASLSAGRREAVLRFYLEGRSQAEVAAELGCSVDAVKTRVHEGLERLRAFFARRGVALSATVLASGLAAEAACAEPALAATCAHTVFAPDMAPHAIALAQEVTLAMFVKNAGLVACASLALGCCVAAATLLAAEPPTPPVIAPQPAVIVPSHASPPLQWLADQPYLASSNGLDDCAFSPDSTLLATRAINSIDVFAMPDGRRLSTIGRDCNFTGMTFLPDGRLAVACSQQVGDKLSGRIEYALLLLDPRSGQELLRIPAPWTIPERDQPGGLVEKTTTRNESTEHVLHSADCPIDLAPTPDGRAVLAICHQDDPRVWRWSLDDLRAERLTWPVPSHGAPLAIACSATGRTAVLWTENKRKMGAPVQVLCFDAAGTPQWSVPLALKDREGDATGCGLGWSPHGRLLVWLSGRETSTPSTIILEPDHGSVISDRPGRYTDDGEVASFQKKLRGPAGTSLSCPDLDHSAWYGHRSSPDGRYLAGTVNSRSSPWLVDVQNWRTLAPTSQNTETYQQCGVAADGTIVAEQQSALAVFTPGASTPLWRPLPSPGNRSSWYSLPCQIFGRFVFINLSDCVVWHDIITGRGGTLDIPRDPNSTPMIWGLDDNHTLLSSDGSWLTAWDLTTGAIRGTLSGVPSEAGVAGIGTSILILSPFLKPREHSISGIYGPDLRSRFRLEVPFQPIITASRQPVVTGSSVVMYRSGENKNEYELVTLDPANGTIHARTSIPNTCRIMGSWGDVLVTNDGALDARTLTRVWTGAVHEFLPGGLVLRKEASKEDLTRNPFFDTRSRYVVDPTTGATLSLISLPIRPTSWRCASAPDASAVIISGGMSRLALISLFPDPHAGPTRALGSLPPDEAWQALPALVATGTEGATLLATEAANPALDIRLRRLALHGLEWQARRGIRAATERLALPFADPAGEQIRRCVLAHLEASAAMIRQHEVWSNTAPAVAEQLAVPEHARRTQSTTTPAGGADGF